MLKEVTNDYTERLFVCSLANTDARSCAGIKWKSQTTPVILLSNLEIFLFFFFLRGNEGCLIHMYTSNYYTLYLPQALFFCIILCLIC